MYRQRQSVLGWARQLMVAFGQTARRWLTDTPQAHGLDRQTITLDLQCVSWILQTSLDKLVHLATLKHLATMQGLTHFDPILVVGCFNAFVSCIIVSNRGVVIKRGFEELAAVSVSCFLRTFLHLSVTDPTSSTLADLRRHYIRTFPHWINFAGLPFRSTMTTIHLLFGRRRDFRLLDDSMLPIQEHVPFSRGLVDNARAECRRMHNQKVPRRFLHFVIHSFSMDPPPPASVIADCLKIIAIDLGCDLSTIRAWNDWCVCSIFKRINVSD